MSNSQHYQQTQEITSPTPRHPPQNQHAFGDGNSDDSDDDDDDDDDDTGFQVYKDQPANARYTSVTPVSPLDPPTNTSQRSFMNHHPAAFSSSSSPARSSAAPPPPPPPSRGTRHTGGHAHYPPDDTTSSSFHKYNNNNSQQLPATDLVHMPALGSDWDKNEARLDKDWEGKDTLINKQKWNNRKDKLAARKSTLRTLLTDFFAGRRNLFGWFNRFMAFGLLLVLILLAFLLSYFLVPRIPEVAYNNETPITGDSTSGLVFQTVDPVRFEFRGKINLAMTAPASYVDPKTSQVTVVIKDLSSTSTPVDVARGTLSTPVKISRKEYSPFSLDLLFRYSASSVKDPVWAAWHEACAHKWPGKEDRPKLSLGIIVQWQLQGRAGTFEERTVLNDFVCPVELSASAA